MDLKYNFFHLQESVKQFDLKDKRTEVINEINAFITHFLDSLPNKKAYQSEIESASLILSQDYRIKETGYELSSILKLFEEAVVNPGIQTASGRHLAAIPSGGIPIAAFADLLSGITNKHVSVKYSCPGGVNVENTILKWAADIFEFNLDTVGGNLTSGGSIASLISLQAAREKYQLKGKDYNRTVVYSSELAHFCIDKAFKYSGMDECVQAKIPSDKSHRIEIKLLEERILEDIQNGLKPFMIIATVGYTATGSIDNLLKISKIAKRYHLWFHVDAAYGGFFQLLSDFKERFRGIEHADSLVLDPHKSLFIPYGSGMVLIKDKEYLQRSNDFSTDYFPLIQHDLDPCQCSIELTKPFRGLRIWLPLMYHGVEIFRDALREKRLLALYAYEELKKETILELGPEPDLTVFTFRYIHTKKNFVGCLNDLNLQIVKAIDNEGTINLLFVIVKGVRWIRVAILSFRSHKEDVDKMLAIIRDQEKYYKF